MKLVAAILLLVAASAAANEPTIGLNLVSAHTSGGYNNLNPGIYVVKDNVSAGVYVNSVWRLTAHAEYHVPLTDNVSVFAGVATGYSYGVLTPIAGVSVKVWNVRVIMIPKTQKSAGVISFAWELK